MRAWVIFSLVVLILLALSGVVAGILVAIHMAKRRQLEKRIRVGIEELNAEWARNARQAA